MNKIWAVMLISVATVMAIPLAHAEGEVARAIVTTDVVDREPVNDLEMIPAGEETVLLFTDLRNMQGQTVLHRWIHGDEQMAEVSFDVRGPRWRVWSSKKMVPEWVGNWTVQVIDTAGVVVAEKSFTYGMAEDAGTAPATKEPLVEEAPAPVTEQAPAMETAPAAVEQNGADSTK